MAEYWWHSPEKLNRMDEAIKKTANNEPKVCLTAEEARLTIDAFGDLAAICRVVGNLDDEISLLELRSKLVRRLEKVEKKDD